MSRRVALPAVAVMSLAVAPVRVARHGRPSAELHLPRAVAADTGRPVFTAADVRFMRGMIAHHAQAILMCSLAPTRTRSEAIRLLAERIDVSQRDEITLMERWLLDRGQRVPAASGEASAGAHGARDVHAMDTMPMPMRMPGMLTDAELAELKGASGGAFDRLFVQRMIEHHEGALTMVRELFSTAGAGQEAAVFRFASDVESDQRAEIARMRALYPTLERQR